MGRDADERVFARAAKQDSVFTTADAVECGLRARQCEYRVACGQWVVVFGGVYQPPGIELDWRGRLRAACMAAEPAAASHRSALALWDLPGQRRHVAELLTPHGDRVRRPEVVAHQSRDLPDDDITAIDGIKVTTPARTLVDVAAVLHSTVLETAVDEALRRELVDFSTLWRRLEYLAKPGRRGIRPLRRVLAKRHPNADLAESAREAMLLRVLREADLPTPVPQFEIRDNAQRLVARVDAAYPDARVAIEYDSYLHHGARAKHVDDLARRNALTALGWQVIHVTAPDLRSGSSLADMVRAILGCAA